MGARDCQSFMNGSSSSPAFPHGSALLYESTRGVWRQTEAEEANFMQTGTAAEIVAELRHRMVAGLNSLISSSISFFESGLAESSQPR